MFQHTQQSMDVIQYLFLLHVTDGRLCLRMLIRTHGSQDLSCVPDVLKSMTHIEDQTRQITDEDFSGIWLLR